jgi:hypothetical protein
MTCWSSKQHLACKHMHRSRRCQPCRHCCRYKLDESDPPSWSRFHTQTRGHTQTESTSQPPDTSRCCEYSFQSGNRTARWCSGPDCSTQPPRLQSCSQPHNQSLLNTHSSDNYSQEHSLRQRQPRRNDSQ